MSTGAGGVATRTLLSLAEHYLRPAPQGPWPIPTKTGTPLLASHGHPPGAPKAPTAQPLTLGSASPGSRTEKSLCALVGFLGKWE